MSVYLGFQEGGEQCSWNFLRAVSNEWDCTHCVLSGYGPIVLKNTNNKLK